MTLDTMSLLLQEIWESFIFLFLIPIFEEVKPIFHICYGSQVDVVESLFIKQKRNFVSNSSNILYFKSPLKWKLRLFFTFLHFLLYTACTSNNVYISSVRTCLFSIVIFPTCCYVCLSNVWYRFICVYLVFLGVSS